MKIVQFMASQAYGGAEKVFVELANALAEQHSVTALLLRHTSYKHRFSAAVRLAELKSNPTSHNPFLHLEIYSVLRGLAPDLIHTHAAKASELIAKVNRLLHLPHLATKHNDRRGRIFNSLAWVSTVSAKAKTSVRPKKGAQVRVIYNGVVAEPVLAGRKDAVFTILAVGRLDQIKGFDVLIRQVGELTFPFRLLIVGEGPEKERLTAQIQKAGLTGKIELLGFRDDIAQLMADAHLVVVSSHQEGGPKVMIEALFYADLLIATPVGAVVEVLPAQFQAEQQQLGRKLTEVWQNYPAYVEQFQQLRREKKDLFAFAGIVDQYVSLYQEIRHSKSLVR